VIALLTVALLLGAAAFAALARTERQPLSIRIVSVRQMDVPGPLHDLYSHVYEVHVSITGWRMYPLYERAARPDGGHWELYVDSEYVSASNDGVAHTPPLLEGEHQIWAWLVDNDGTPLFRHGADSNEVRVCVCQEHDGNGREPLFAAERGRR
jgi:hypothetical protein